MMSCGREAHLFSLAPGTPRLLSERSVAMSQRMVYMGTCPAVANTSLASRQHTSSIACFPLYFCLSFFLRREGSPNKSKPRLCGVAAWMSSQSRSSLARRGGERSPLPCCRTLLAGDVSKRPQTATPTSVQTTGALTTATRQCFHPLHRFRPVQTHAHLSERQTKSRRQATLPPAQGDDPQLPRCCRRFPRDQGAPRGRKVDTVRIARSHRNLSVARPAEQQAVLERVLTTDIEGWYTV